MAVLILFVLVLAAAPNGIKAAAENATAEQDRNCRGYTRDGHQCYLPFIYKGVSYHTCTDVDNPPGRYWCSLTPDYDADKQWKRCAGIICDDCKVYATNGRRCIFPFVYKYKTYNYCTNADNGDTLWCAHSSVYNGQWGRCGDTLCGDCKVHTEWRHQCKFPFYYKRVRYEHCTRRDNPKPWCSLNGRSSQRGVDWDNCIANVCPEHPVMPVPAAATDKNTPRCSATLGYSSTYSAYTVYGKKCALPFIYKGVSYPSATDVDNSGVKWCSLTPNYDHDRRWERYFGEICSGCTVRTENNGLCHLPFEYKGRNYSYCSIVDNPRLWCSFDPVYSSRWGPCLGQTECPVDRRYLGCFQDNGLDFILNDDGMQETIDNEWCITDCREKSFKYAGTKNGNECYCGNDDNYSRYGHCVTESDCTCDSPCPGNNTQMCGGNYSLSVYSADCPQGKYGKFCDMTCHCNNEARCDVSTGQCPNNECAPDWYGPACNEECMPGKYGQFCNMTCNCMNAVGCNVSTGQCPNDKCAPGWYGPTCNDECMPGKYGQFCNMTCNCLDAVGCDVSTGRCPNDECAPGWHGPTCNGRVIPQATVETTAPGTTTDEMSSTTSQETTPQATLETTTPSTTDEMSSTASQGITSSTTAETSATSATAVSSTMGKASQNDLNSLYLGCFKDNSNDRILKGANTFFKDLTNQRCITKCRQGGWKYAATQGTCLCGNDDYARHGGCGKAESCRTCNRLCIGDRSQECGGKNYYSVYLSE